MRTIELSGLICETPWRIHTHWKTQDRVEHFAEQGPRLNFVIDVAADTCGTIALFLGKDICRCPDQRG